MFLLVTYLADNKYIPKILSVLILYLVSFFVINDLKYNKKYFVMLIIADLAFVIYLTTANILSKNRSKIAVFDLNTVQKTHLDDERDDLYIIHQLPEDKISDIFLPKN